MKLYFIGHNERYAVEQMLLTLFPDERPVYPEGAPLGEDGELILRWEEGTHADVQLRYSGKLALGRVELPAAAEHSAVALTRARRRALQRAFYRAAADILDTEPAWGMLSGVRPVKLPVRAVLQGATMEEAKRALVEDYHVHPAQAALAMDCAETTLAVRASLLPQDISLYVGIPFCPSRCAYCSFISAAAGGERLIVPYLEGLLAEIEAAGQRVLELGLRVRSVYVGGGTPTTLSPEQLTELLARLRKSFDLPEDIELTVEAGRPDSITVEKLQAIHDGGGNRVSLNPQTMQDDVLRNIGRNHTAQDIRDAWPLVRQHFSCVNMDLIAGLPGDDLPGFRASLSEVIAFAPENITVHTLARKKGASLQRDAALPHVSVLTQMLSYTADALRSAGYRPYYLYRQKYSGGSFENVGWTKPGLHSIYNICMMEELHSVLALGAGAVSKSVDYRAGKLSRLANPKYPQDYLRALPEVLAQKRTLNLITSN